MVEVVIIKTSDSTTGHPERHLGDAASFEAHGASFSPIVNAFSAFATSADDIAREIARIVQVSNEIAATYQPPDLSELTVLPHKRHLVPKHQDAKRREQLKVWGLRK